jgi:hypothetical protein
MLGVIFTIIACYFLYRFVFGFVIPIVIATKTVRAKMKDMNEETAESESPHTSSSNRTFHKNEPSSQAAKGDYIDFEEIK